MKTKLIVFLILPFSFILSALAGSATWKVNPGSSDWNTATNWTPETVPNGPSDTATFAASNVTDVFFSAQFATEVASIVFTPGASAYTIAPVDSLSHLTISGGGVINNSGIVQQFGNDTHVQSVPFFITGGSTIGELITFKQSFYFQPTASAGNGNFVLPVGSLASHFFDDTTAGNATFDVSEELFFDYSSNAGDATFQINSQPNNASGGFIGFNLLSSAENATFTISGGTTPDLNGEGSLGFGDNSTAANATIIANGGANGGKGGRITFSEHATGGTAQVSVFGNGNLDISGMLSSVSIGSLQGDGDVFLGRRMLKAGNNSLSTSFSGVIQDGGIIGGSGGALGKIGSGKLTLSGANTYTGGTTVSSGVLLVTNGTGSGTGTGTVTVVAGTLGGSGTISGAVTVGTGGGAGGSLAPSFGSKKQVTLTLQSSLTFRSGATYIYGFKARSNQSRSDLVIANGVTINGAKISLKGKTQGTLTLGLVLTVISNTSATPISGTFSNLADGAIVNIGGNNLQASYTGGDGNDLTLTVVP